jgi:hypothetical protein
MQSVQRYLLPVVLFACVSWAQTARAPDPELKKLDYFVGTWNTTGNMQTGPSGGGGTVSATDKISWQGGQFFLIGQSEFTTPMGKGSELAVWGYDPGRKVFTYDSFSSDGEHEIGTGRFDGATWTWTSEDPNAPVKWRYVQKVHSPRTFSSSFEVTRDGTHWTPLFTSTSTKQ